MVRKLQTLIIVSILISATSLVGQKKLHKANKQYDLNHYSLAIETYNEFLKDQPGNLEARTNLADSYRMSNDLVAASKIYEDLVAIENIDPVVIKNYGLTLMKMGKYDQAKYYFQIYKVYDAKEGSHYAMACDFATHLFENPITHDIESVDCNTSSSDFGVSFLGDQMIFSSFRDDITTPAKGKALNGNILYKADLDDKLYTSSVKTLRPAIAEKSNIGPVSYNENGGIVVYAKNKIKDGGAHVSGDDSKHSLYVATLKKDGNWEDDHSFRYNEFGTSTAFPNLAFDGGALYFASNRVGGYGGYDLYVSYLKKEGWTYPRNLGPNINSEGNEITPYFNEGSLYFASDYIHGMGGFDIFESRVDGGEWSYPKNLGNGINSPGDDYYPAVKRGTEMIFFSSNRLGGEGMDDIYLAVPVKDAKEELLSEVPPAAVNLSDLSAVNTMKGLNGMAQTVAENETMQVKVLTFEDEKVLQGREIIEVSTLRNTQYEIVSDNFVRSIDLRILGCPPALKFEYDDEDNANEVASAEKAAIQRVDASMEVEIDGSIVEYITVKDLEELASEELPKSTNVEQNGAGEVIPELSAADGMLSKDIEVTDKKAVDVQNVASKGSTESMVTAEPITEEQVPAAYKIPDFKSVSPAAAPLNLDISTAKRVALGNLLPESAVYFIQLAALYNSAGNVNEYNHLKKFGNLYKMYSTKNTKIKLGYFLDRSEAQAVLNQVKAKGYGDAFITKDQLSSADIELIVASEAQSNYNSYTSKPKSAPRTTTSTNTTLGVKNYKIRLASYEDPIWFDIAKAKDLGQIEQWTKGGWTIFILGGYSTYSEAESARIRAVNQGFADAEVVIDNNGILERLRKN